MFSSKQILKVYKASIRAELVKNLQSWYDLIIYPTHW